MKRKKWYKHKTFWIIAVVVLLISFRIALPYIVKSYVNNTLRDLDGYTGSVEDIDIALYRGAYKIQGIEIYKVDNEVKEPFVIVPEVDLSVEWDAIFDGSVVGEIYMYEPDVHFALSADTAASQTGEEVNWVQLVQDLIPIRINRFEVVDGKLGVIGIHSEPELDLSIKDFHLALTNITNAANVEDTLSSSITASAQAPDFSGRMGVEGRANLIKEMPDLLLDSQVKGVELTSFNPLTRYYGGFDFEKGVFEAYSEVAITQNKITGYVKPVLHDVTVFRLDEDSNRSVGEFFKEVVIEGVQEIFENQPKQQTATKIPLRGDLEQVQTNVFKTIIVALGNAYIEALTGQIDGEISLEEVKRLNNIYRSDVKG